MSGPVFRFLARDHERLDALLGKAFLDPERIDHEAYHGFRTGLLRHIGMEEKLLLPAAQAAGGRPLKAAEKLHRDHGALTALLVGPPSPPILMALRGILGPHNQLEEGPEGFYEEAEALLAPRLDEALEMLKAAPEVPVRPYNTRPEVHAATRRALRWAGYDLDALGV